MLQRILQYCLILTLVAPLLLSGCSSSEKDKQKFYDSALKYIEKGESEAAILDLRSAIQIDPKFEQARYKLGLIYLEQKKPKEAFAELMRAANLNSQNIDANLKVAQFYFMAKKIDEAKKHINNVLTVEPLNNDALILMATFELASKNYDEALAVLNKLGDTVESKPSLQILKGNIYAAKKQGDLAEEAFKKAISLEPDKLISYKVLLNFYEKSQNNQKAKQTLDEMLEKFPENVEVHLLLAGYYRKFRQFDKVEEELIKVTQLDAKNVQQRFILADFYHTASKDDKAIETLQQARKDFPDSMTIAAQLASIYFDLKKFEESETIIAEIQQKEPSHQSLKLLQARQLQKEGKLRESIPALQKINADYPNWPDPYFYLALTHFGLGDVDLAQLEVTNAIQKNRTNAKYHTLLAQLYLQQGSFEDAIKESSISLKLNDKNFPAVMILCRSLIGAKQHEKALKILNDLNDRFPDNKEILINLAIASFRTNDLEKGEKALIKITELDPGNTSAIAMLVSLKYRNDMQAAEHFIQQQIEIAPDDARLYLMLGETLSRQQKKTEALAAYEKSKDLDPNNTQAYLLSAKLLKETGKTDGAMQKYQEILDQDPKSIPAHMGMAVLYETKGDTAEAAKKYEEILEIREDYAPAANNLSWILASSPDGDLGRALLLAMIAKKAAPNDPHIADTLGWVYHHRGSYQLAIAQYELALNNKPDDPSILYHLALAQNANNQTADALKTIDKCFEKNIEFTDRENAESLRAELKKKSSETS